MDETIVRLHLPSLKGLGFTQKLEFLKPKVIFRIFKPWKQTKIMKEDKKGWKVRVCVLDVDYFMDGNIAVVRIWGKTKKGKTIEILDKKFKPYFYVQPEPDLGEKELGSLVERIGKLDVDGLRPVKIEPMDKKFLGKEIRVLKVSVDRPSDVPKFRELLKDWDIVKGEYEYAVSFYRRYMIDRGIIPMGWIGVTGNLSGDTIEAEGIEGLTDNGYPNLHVMAFDIEVARDRIIIISVVDNRGFRKAITYKGRGLDIIKTGNEKEMIERFLEIVRERDPDILVGYNTDRFDFPRLVEKADKYKIPLKLSRDESELVFRRRGRVSSAQFKGRVHVDIYDFVENILRDSMSTEVLTLDRVSRELMGEGKDDISWQDIEKAWNREEIGKISKYCIRDSELTLKLAENLLPQMFELCRVSGQKLFDVSRMSYSQLVEWVLMRKAFTLGEIAPNRPKYDEIGRRRKIPPYTGGYVHPPEEGIHEKIALFDFQSLYPSITITHNISPETLDKRDCKRKVMVPGSEHYYCADKIGFIPMVLEEIVNKRMEIQDKMKGLDPKTISHRNLHNRQYALKILANASYGYYGYAGSRWYSRVCAESITAWGRFYIRKIMNLAKRMKLKVIYGDTDSLFLKIKRKRDVKDFLDRANKSLPGVMELDFRDLYESGIFVKAKTGMAAKKRYALIDSRGKMVIRGFEKVRRDWSNIAKDTQERVLSAVLKDRSPEKALRIVRKSIGDIKNGKVKLEDLVIYTQLTKPIGEYEQVGPHVSAARKAIERGISLRVGSTVSFIITKGSGSISDRAEPVETAKEYDPEYYINNQILPAALRILSGLGITEEDILGTGKGQVSLKNFIK